MAAAKSSQSSGPDAEETKKHVPDPGTPCLEPAPDMLPVDVKSTSMSADELILRLSK